MKPVKEENSSDNPPTITVGSLGDDEVGPLKDFTTTYDSGNTPVDSGEDTNA